MLRASSRHEATVEAVARNCFAGAIRLNRFALGQAGSSDR
jgi:hypothetical protein